MQNFWLCVAGSVVTIAVEVFFFVAVFVQGARKYLLGAGAALHVGIYLTMAAPFFTWVALYSTFVDIESLRRRFVGSETVLANSGQPSAPRLRAGTRG